MSEKLKYKVGDELLVRVKILDVDGKTTRYHYLLSTSGWLSKEELNQITVGAPQKPKVTQEVMVWYEEVKSERADWTINNWLRTINTPSEVCYWLYGENHLENQHALATLIAYGPDAVEVEKEKRYKVSLVGLKESDGKPQYLFKDHGGNIMASWLGTPLTQKELEEDGFGDVFNNPLFELEEVE
ncbi:DUF1642 domain-containing protein [Streptococcus hyointestinalis]|uniref:DUF1642 domain-containing protein n=1 Tax=Streptococcus hyointestinalis TaxID=1337 RepID=UPI003515358E